MTGAPSRLCGYAVKALATGEKRIRKTVPLPGLSATAMIPLVAFAYRRAWMMRSSLSVSTAQVSAPP